MLSAADVAHVPSHRSFALQASVWFVIMIEESISTPQRCCHRCPPPTPTARTEVEEAKDQSGISADLQVDLVPFDKLVKHIGRKVCSGI
jgi:transposase